MEMEMEKRMYFGVSLGFKSLLAVLPWVNESLTLCFYV